jgi:hypothetical protein
VKKILRMVVIGAAIAAGAGAVTPVRHALLRGAGRVLVVADSIEPAHPPTLIAMDVESGPAGAIALSDLYRAQPTVAVGLLDRAFTTVDRELERRGVVVPDVLVEMLTQLGVPRSAVTRIPAGEGGTTDTAAALADWARTHPASHVVVVVGPSHGRRYRRALSRVWPAGQPAPVVVTTPHGLFRADDWWQSRTTLREGLVEMEKLALDYARHPW